MPGAPIPAALGLWYPRGVTRLLPVFPVDPSDEELARDWTLSPKDMIEVRRCRGNDNRHRFAIQLCALRALGRFASDEDRIPVRILNHVGGQIDAPPTLFVAAPARAATDTEHTSRIRAHLGFQTFDENAQKPLTEWLSARACAGVPAAPLLTQALGVLRSWKVEIPATSTLERLIGSCTARSEKDMWARIFGRLSPAMCESIDRLLDVTDSDRRSPLYHLKQYPPEPKPMRIRLYLERAEFLRAMGVGQIDFGDVGAEVVAHLCELVRRYDVRELRRFAPEKRHAMLACFLAETQKTILDHIIEMNRVYLITLERHARNRLDEKAYDIRQKSQLGLTMVLRAIQSMMDDPENRTMADVYRDLGEDAVREAVAQCSALETIGEHGIFDELRSRHHLLKRYLPAFLALPFKGAAGTDKLLEAIELARLLHRGEREELGDTAPIDFASKAWRHAIVGADGALDSKLWELALAFKVRDALQRGELYLPESRQHVSIWNFIRPEEAWAHERANAYVELGLPTEADAAIERLTCEFDVAAAAFAKGLDDNHYAVVRDGAVVLSKDDGLERSKAVRDLKRLINTRLPKVRIEELLVDVDGWCGFTRELMPPSGYLPRAENMYPSLLAALVAHGTNIGIARMASSTKGISVDTLQHLSRWLLDKDTLKAASRVLVDFHHKLDLASTWGDGSMSSSDGQRFSVQRSSLIATFYPRYYGFYDRALSIYAHVSDQHAVFGVRAISCALRESGFVIDGLLENDTIVRPREHCTDTHGFTEHVFGLCHLLGFAFMPRLKDASKQRLFKCDRTKVHQRIDPIFSGTVDLGLIREQWDPLVRLASSLKQRAVPAHVVLTRLASSSDRLAKALSMLGRLVKTTYLLRYFNDGELRARIRLQLCRGEARHALARLLFFGNNGAFRSGDYFEIMNKVSALSLLSNAVLVWNTVQMGRLLERLEANGHPVDREVLARVSPLASEHVIPNGTYHFDRAAARAA